ncbi:sensor histidine kinase [Chitinophagaceae bacterium LWZ2-11]
MNKNKKILIIIIHVAVWLCFFALPYIFFPKPKDISQSWNTHILIHFICTYTFLVVFYYLNTLVLIPKLLFNKRWIWYIVIVIACFILFSFFPRLITNLINPIDELPFKQQAMQGRPFMPGKIPGGPRYWRGGMRWFPFFPGSYAIFILVFTIGTCISVMQQWLRVEQNKKAVETEKLNTELSFLKSQINPHFFFNTLNNIYSLAVVGSPQTASAVMKLSSIMRYILSDTQSDKVPLENEINFIKNYIDLQLVRLTDKVKVEFNTNGDITNKQIAPLLFIPFVENAFKYGVSTKDFSGITFTMNAEDEAVTFTAINNIVKSENAIHETTGIGINNVKRRLELLYPGKHTLNVSELNNTFKIELHISIK